MPDLTIDRMSEKDIEPILKIEQASFARPWGRISFLNELYKDYASNFVLKQQNFDTTYRIIAYLCLHTIADEIHVLKIAVVPDRRGRGIAREFLNKCLNKEAVCGIRSAFLEVRQSNTAGISLYEKSGFEIEAQRPNYFSDTLEDAIFMRKNFLKEV